MDKGWYWVYSSTKIHYFKDGRSLCGRYNIHGKALIAPGNKCAQCLKFETMGRNVKKVKL